MSIGLKERSVSDVHEPEIQGKGNGPLGKMPKGHNKPPTTDKKKSYPQKRSMNLYYKPDRTTKPATVALYSLFALACLALLCKLLIFDVWSQTKQAQDALAAAEDELLGIMLQLTDYNEVRERYYRYAATDEERVLIDRMEILALLDDAVGSTATMHTLTISGDTVRLQFSGVTLGQTAYIVRKLEASPIVKGTVVNTASTTQEGVTDEDESSPVQANVLIYLTKEVAE